MLPVHPFTQSHFELVHIHDAHYMHRVVLIGLSMSFVIGEVFEMGDGRLRGGGLHHQHFMDVIACCEYRHSAIRYDECMGRERILNCVYTVYIAQIEVRQ